MYEEHEEAGGGRGGRPIADFPPRHLGRLILHARAAAPLLADAGD